MDSATTKLKIKIKYLAAEGSAIRKEEKKALKSARKCKKFAKSGPGFKGTGRDIWYSISDEHYDLYHELREHRIDVVRDTARHSLLAYAFLRGTPYSKVEAKTHTPIDFYEVWDMVKRFSDTSHLPSDKRRWDEWQQEARGHMAHNARSGDSGCVGALFNSGFVPQQYIPKQASESLSKEPQAKKGFIQKAVSALIGR